MLLPILVALGLGVVIAESYFLVYPRHGYRLPLGFDSSWYVWRARYVASQGIGPLGTSARPGHALLSAILGSVTGRSQLELAVVFPLVLVSVFALALAAFWEGLGNRGTWDWIIPVAVAGALLGTTRLVSENVANLLNLALVIAGFALVARAVAEERLGRLFWGAVVLMVGAGLAHWVFLGVIAGILGVAILLAIPSSIRHHGGGTPVVRTEAGILGSLAIATGGLLLATVAALLKGPLATFEIREDTRRFMPKFREDLRRLVIPLVGPVAGVGAIGWAKGAPDEDGDARTVGRRFSLRLVGAWMLVSLTGIAYGVATRRLPPHRFVALIVAVPLALALSEAALMLRAGADRLFRGRLGRETAARMFGVAAAALGLVILTIPGALGWYHHGPGLWFDEKGLQQAGSAAGYVRSLPAEKPVVFLVDPLGPAGVLSIPLKERTIRVAMPPDRQTDVHVYAGEPRALLAGRRSFVGRDRVDAAALPYWTDVRPLLRAKPPVLILDAFAQDEFATAVNELGAREIGPGVALLQGPSPARTLRQVPLPTPVPGVGGSVLWVAVLLVLLLVAGWGWASVFVPHSPARIRIAVAPAFGAATLMIGSLLTAKSGIRLAGAGGVVTFLTMAAVGLGLAHLLRVRPEEDLVAPQD